MESSKTEKTLFTLQFYFNEDLKKVLNTQKAKRHMAKSLLQEIFYLMKNIKASYKKKNVIDALVGVAGSRLPCERVLKEIVSKQIEPCRGGPPKKLFIITTDECTVYSPQQALNANPDVKVEFGLLSSGGELRIHWGGRMRRVPLSSEKGSTYETLDSLSLPHKKLFYQLVKQGCSVLNAWTFMKKVSGNNASYNTYKRWYSKVNTNEEFRQELKLDRLFEFIEYDDDSFIISFKERSLCRPVFFLKDIQNKCVDLLFTRIEYGMETELAKLITSGDFTGYSLNEKKSHISSRDNALVFTVECNTEIRLINKGKEVK